MGGGKEKGMNTMEKLFSVVLGLSVSGGLSILVLLGCGKFLKGRLGWGWLYYLWLIAVFRLLLPFSLKIPVFVLPEMGVNQVQPEQQTELEPEKIPLPPSPMNLSYQEKASSIVILPLWSIWAAGVGISLGKRCLDYRRFFRCLRKGWTPISAPNFLQHFQNLMAQAGIRSKVEFYIHPNLSTPMLIGLFHPCVILPCLELPKSELDFTILHELSHCRRRDIIYKLLVQLCLCIHWFNPLVYWMEWELNRLCELTCDEAILKELTPQERAAYGDTLINSLLYFGETIMPRSSTALNRKNSLFLLKERLGEIMKAKRKTRTAKLLSIVIACMVICGTVATGVQAGENLSDSVSSPFLDLKLKEYQNFFAMLNPRSIADLEKNSALAAQSKYICPVEEDKGKISISAEYIPDSHNGIDIAAEKGTSIYAIADGTVETADTDAKYGKYIVLLHNNNIESRYYHCDALFVTAGQKVYQGDKIAEIGQTGMATGPHLHIEILKEKQLQNPADYIEIFQGQEK